MKTTETDILMSYDTDISFENGDLMLSTGSDLLQRRVIKLLLSETNDWRRYPHIGANPNIFIGNNNTREVGRNIERYITSKIQPFITPAIIDVRVVPIDFDAVKGYISVYYAGAAPINIPFKMDFINGLAITDFDERVDKVVSSDKLKFNDQQDYVAANPLKDIISKQRG